MAAIKPCGKKELKHFNRKLNRLKKVIPEIRAEIDELNKSRELFASEPSKYSIHSSQELEKRMEEIKDAALGRAGVQGDWTVVEKPKASKFNARGCIKKPRFNPQLQKLPE